MQSPIYQEWIQEDIKEAEARTKTKTIKTDIMEVLEERFDFIRKPLREKIEAITDIDLLRGLLKKSVKVSTLEEFERFLDLAIS